MAENYIGNALMGISRDRQQQFQNTLAQSANWRANAEFASQQNALQQQQTERQHQMDAKQVLAGAQIVQMAAQRGESAKAVAEQISPNFVKEFDAQHGQGAWSQLDDQAVLKMAKGLEYHARQQLGETLPQPTLQKVGPGESLVSVDQGKVNPTPAYSVPAKPELRAVGDTLVNVDPTTHKATPLYTNPDSAGGKPPAGYRFKADKSLEFIPGGPADPETKATTGLGSREGVMFQRVMSAANSATEALKNISELPVGASTGVLGVGASPGHGLLASAKGALTNTLASQELQDYNTMLAGVSRNLSTIETAGLAPNGSLTGSMDSIQLRAGDTNMTKLRKLAEMRQVIIKGIETNLANPRIPEEQKNAVRDIIGQVKTAIPFTQSDITKLQQRQSKDPTYTFQDLIQEQGLKNPGASRETKAPVKVNTPQEALALPPGTQFVTPDGRVKVRP